jgi:putative DNA primase/helicase
VTVTGDVYGNVLAVAKYDGFLNKLPKKEVIEKLSSDAEIVKVDYSDKEKFKLLFDGKWDEVKKEERNGLKISLVQTYKSQSEADIGFCTLLAYKYGNDPDAIDKEFRNSGLYREKWDRDDYREDTIQRGIAFAASHPNGEKDLTQFRHTDTGNAERLVSEFGEDFRYLHDTLKWLHWDGQCWNSDQTAEIHRAAKETVNAMHCAASTIQDDSMRQKFSSWVARSESRGSRENMVALAQKETEFSVLTSQFDTNPMLLNVANGTLAGVSPRDFPRSARSHRILAEIDWLQPDGGYRRTMLLATDRSWKKREEQVSRRHPVLVGGLRSRD